MERGFRAGNAGPANGQNGQAAGQGGPPPQKRARPGGAMVPPVPLFNAPPPPPPRPMHPMVMAHGPPPPPHHPGLQPHHLAFLPVAAYGVQAGAAHHGAQAAVSNPPAAPPLGRVPFPFFAHGLPPFAALPPGVVPGAAANGVVAHAGGTNSGAAVHAGDGDGKHEVTDEEEGKAVDEGALEGAGVNYGALAEMPREQLVQRHLLSVSRLASVTAENEAIATRVNELRQENGALHAMQVLNRPDADGGANGGANGHANGHANGDSAASKGAGSFFERLLKLEGLHYSELMSRHTSTLAALAVAERENEELCRIAAKLEEANLSLEQALGHEDSGYESDRSCSTEHDVAHAPGPQQWALVSSSIPAGLPETLQEALAPSKQARVVLAADGKTITHVNAAWCDACGFQEEEAIGQTLALVQGSETDSIVARLLAGAAMSGCYVEALLVNYAKGNVRFRNRLSAIPLRAPGADPQSRPEAFLGVVKRLPAATSPSSEA